MSRNLNNNFIQHSIHSRFVHTLHIGFLMQGIAIVCDLISSTLFTYTHRLASQFDRYTRRMEINPHEHHIYNHTKLWHVTSFVTNFDRLISSCQWAQGARTQIITQSVVICKQPRLCHWLLCTKKRAMGRQPRRDQQHTRLTNITQQQVIFARRLMLVSR